MNEKSLWKLFSADYCHLNEVGVSLLVHALVYESGRNAFWSLVTRDFNDTNWKVRMQAGTLYLVLDISFTAINNLPSKKKIKSN